ncbi:1946_t:CDS:2, partial [Cetraspora pellucida]
MIQSVTVSYSNDEYNLTSEDLSNSSLLLLYLASVVLNSYIPDNNESRESFMLARRLYNEITNNKLVDSRVIILYINENNHYKTSSTEPSHVESTLQIIDDEPSSQNTNETFAPITSYANEKNASINNNNSTKSVHSDISILQ